MKNSKQPNWFRQNGLFRGALKRMEFVTLLLALTSAAVPLFGETNDLLSESPKTVLAGFETQAEL